MITIKKLITMVLTIVIMGQIVWPSVLEAQTSDKEVVVQALLFYSPSCSHCHYVIKEVLVPMMEEYDPQLQILGVDVSQPEGQNFYQAAIQHYQIPAERRGVPTLIVDDLVLVGSEEIPSRFPTLVEEGLAAGGISWPDVPGLEQFLAPAAETESQESAVEESEADVNRTESSAAPAEVEEETSSSLAEEIDTAEATSGSSDGFFLAWLILIGMVIALGYTFWTMLKIGPKLLHLDKELRTWMIPILAGLGLIVAAYLAYVEITNVEAVCGPVGECNQVQSSIYARIFGIPIAVLGLINYLAILILWGIPRFITKSQTQLSFQGLLGITVFGTLFSIYLTLLEIFVIRAVCIWCLSSAIITTLLMVIVVITMSQYFSSRGPDGRLIFSGH